ncbi:ArsR/SmtB family transcription factor [Staphylococcus xylosus]|uniref:ArsR/SmtB family transcription factor n=1 Tax=Staphylococcus sp. AS1337 TaxID=3434042 RepID=UPI003F546DE7
MVNDYICEVQYMHKQKIENAQNFIEEAAPKSLLSIFRKISDETKVKIILGLLKESEMCVCDISVLLNMSIATTSHHLRLLYKKGVLDKYKEGKMSYYFIKDEQIKTFFINNL